MSCTNEKALEVISTLDVGGIEMMMVRLLENGLKSDLCVCIPNYGKLESRAAKTGCRIFHLPRRSESMMRHHSELFHIIHDNGYSVVHIHTQNAFLALLQVWTAKLAGAECVIVHSHNTSDWRENQNTNGMKWKKLLYRSADIRMACGKDAAVWLFGTDKDVYIVPLPVNTEELECTEEEMLAIRMRMKIRPEQKVLLHAGSFRDAKNQVFLLDVMEKIIKKDPDCILLFAGDGSLRKSIQDEVVKRNLGENICFLGNVADMSRYYKAADVFLLPSLYEGFPTVLLEAQTAGLPCIVSDAVDPHIDETGMITFLSINKESSADRWAEQCLVSLPVRDEVRRKCWMYMNEKYGAKEIAAGMNHVYSCACRQNG